MADDRCLVGLLSGPRNGLLSSRVESGRVESLSVIHCFPLLFVLFERHRLHNKRCF
jgi:hypothetical protein